MSLATTPDVFSPKYSITPLAMAAILRETIIELHKNGIIGRAKHTKKTHPLLATRPEIYIVIEKQLVRSGYHPWARIAMKTKTEPHATKDLADKAKDTYWQECCMDCQQFHWHGNKYVGDQRCNIMSNLYRPVLLYAPWARAWNSSERNLVPWGPSTKLTHKHIRIGDIVSDGSDYDGLVMGDNDGLFVVWDYDGITLGDIQDITSVVRGGTEVAIGSRPRNNCPPTEFYFINPYNTQVESRFMEKGRLSQNVVDAAIVWHSSPVSGRQMRRK